MGEGQYKLGSRKRGVSRVVRQEHESRGEPRRDQQGKHSRPRISQLHDLLKEERGKKEAVSKHRRVRSETRWLRALRDCENSHNMEIKAQMMIAAQRIADEKYI